MSSGLNEELRDALNEEKMRNNQLLDKKKKFINEIKSGLGNVIKENPNKVKFIEKTFWVRFKDSIKSFFTKF